MVCQPSMSCWDGDEGCWGPRSGSLCCLCSYKPTPWPRPPWDVDQDDAKVLPPRLLKALTSALTEDKRRSWWECPKGNSGPRWTIELVKCNFSKLNGSFCGGNNHAVTLYTLTVPSSTITLWSSESECAQNHKNTAYITKIWVLYGQFSTNARIYGHACINTGDLATLHLQWPPESPEPPGWLDSPGSPDLPGSEASLSAANFLFRYLRKIWVKY